MDIDGDTVELSVRAIVMFVALGLVGLGGWMLRRALGTLLDERKARLKKAEEALKTVEDQERVKATVERIQAEIDKGDSKVKESLAVDIMQTKSRAKRNERAILELVERVATLEAKVTTGEQELGKVRERIHYDFAPRFTKIESVLRKQLEELEQPDPGETKG